MGGHGPSSLSRRLESLSYHFNWLAQTSVMLGRASPRSPCGPARQLELTFRCTFASERAHLGHYIQAPVPGPPTLDCRPFAPLSSTPTACSHALNSRSNRLVVANFETSRRAGGGADSAKIDWTRERETERVKLSHLLVGIRNNSLRAPLQQSIATAYSWLRLVVKRPASDCQDCLGASLACSPLQCSSLHCQKWQ